ncbi:DUF3592 domain-containing protein [Streptomyces sp. NPDC041068]|uniref:DUF3592 domain-containing protein n=1 Tax=Streptomyces sp. NPDC041068 TaxID=3155130 RepID=UPI0033DEED03
MSRAGGLAGRIEYRGILMEFMFYVVPGFIAVVVILMAVKVIKRSAEVSSAWSSGLTAEARCLRTYTTTSGHGDSNHVSTTLHHVYEFTTREGRAVRFEEENGPATTVEGDIVTVHYTDRRPEAATAHAPRPFTMAASTIGLLCFFGLMLIFCVYFMVSANDFFGDDVFSDMP